MSWIGVVTNAGAALLAGWAASGNTLNVTGAVTGSGTVAEANLRAQTAVSTPCGTGSIARAEVVNGGVRYKVLAGPGTVAYQCRQVGIMAKLGSDGAETLLALYQDAGGVSIPAASAAPDFNFTIYCMVAMGTSGTLNVTVDPAAVATLGDIQDALAEVPHSYAYDGANLKTVFGTAAALHAAVAAGDFSKIRVGDYWPLEISGTIKDFATNADRSLVGADVSLDETVILEVAGIDVYRGYLDRGGTSNIPHHLVMVSRDCVQGLYVKMNNNSSDWFYNGEGNPWLGSALYRTLNDPDDGLLKLLLAGELGSCLYTNGEYNTGMSFKMEAKQHSQTSATGGSGMNRGPLFLPSEREVWGERMFGEDIKCAAPRWPLYAGSARRANKKCRSVGSLSDLWWMQETAEGYDNRFCGAVNGEAAWQQGHSEAGVVLCFLLV